MVGSLGRPGDTHIKNATGKEVESSMERTNTDDAMSLNPDYGRLMADAGLAQERINLRNNLRLGTWNVRTLNQAGNLFTVTREMERCNIKILGVAETHWIGKGQFNTNQGKLIVYSGGINHYAGVAVIFSKETSKSMISYKAMKAREYNAPMYIAFIDYKKALTP